MEVSREELAIRLGQMSDEELRRHVGGRDLTPLAVEVATSILLSRGIAVSASSSDLDDTVSVAALDNPADENADLVFVAEALNAVEAHVIKRFLESRGMFAVVWGEYTPVSLLEIKPGFLPRVQVRGDQAAQAREALAAMRRGELENPEVFDAEFVSDPSHSDSDSSRFDSAGASPPSAARPAPRAAAPPNMSIGSSILQTAVNPVAPPSKGVLSRLLVLVIGVVVTVWLWATLTH